MNFCCLYEKNKNHHFTKMIHMHKNVVTYMLGLAILPIQTIDIISPGLEGMGRLTYKNKFTFFSFEVFYSAQP